MRTQAKVATAAILFGVLGAAVMSGQQHKQPLTVLPATSQNQLAKQSVDSSQQRSAPVPAQVKIAQATVAAQTAPADTSVELGAQVVATRSQVTFQNGLLEIRAENAPMGDVLRAVQRATGASIDFPGLASERVSVTLGPGALRDTVTSLLDGSRYDYILLSSQQSNSIERIVLSVRRDSGGLPPLSKATDGGQQPTVEQETETPQPPVHVPNMKQITEQQQLQFEKQFGACIIQGCDAS